MNTPPTPLTGRQRFWLRHLRRCGDGSLGAYAAAHGLSSEGWIAKILGAIAVALASVNIFGGFLVTQRMLAMYKKKGQ